jgi:hypothetical protein
MWSDGFVGIASVFRALGFAEIARRLPGVTAKCGR